MQVSGTFGKKDTENAYYRKYIIQELGEVEVESVNNWVLIEVDLTSTLIKLVGNTLRVDSSFEPEKNSPVTGIVRSKSITVDSIELGHVPGLKFDLKEGDRVYYHYLSYMNAIRYSERRAFKINGKLHMFVHLRSIFFSVRNGIRQMFGGVVLGRPVFEKNGNPRFRLPKKEATNIFEIVCIGEEVTYLTEGYRSLPKDFVEEGDHVLTMNISNIPLEQKIFETLGERLYRFNQYQIKAVIEL